MYTLRYLNKVLKLPKLRQVYLALVESIIAYGWGGAFENTINHLKIRRNQIIRLLLNKNRICAQ